MYGSCTFNNVKYNSTCVRQVTPPEPAISGGVRLRQRRRKVLIRQFFDLVGLKLIFNTQLFNLLGYILLAKKYNFSINAQILYQLKQNLELSGQELYPFTFEQELIGFKKFLKSEQIDIKSLKLFLSQKNYELHGVKLNDLIQYQALKGNKSFYNEETQKILGEKDITALLEALDLLDFDE